MDKRHLEIVTIAKQLKEESDKLSALLLLPEVCSDAKLAKHYRLRIRALAPTLEALAAFEACPTDDELRNLENEFLLLRAEQNTDPHAYAGAGVCMRAINKDTDDLLRLCNKLPSCTFSVCESGAGFLRAECKDAQAYALLCALKKGALGEDVSFSIYPILSLPDVQEEDVRTDIFLNGGKGGQNVNKVETAVRMTHLPSGVTVTCRDERSQLQNKKRAAKLLRIRVAEHYKAMQSALIEKAKREV